MNKFSEHFSYDEMTLSQTASRKGIDNTPPEYVKKNLERLCLKILEPARAALGALIVSSAYRCKALNKAVGGSDSSGHPDGYCADIVPVKVTKIEFARWVKNNCEFDQIILEFGTKDDPAWVHVSADPRNRRQVLQILRGTGYISVEL
jgi:hypothetical protein